MLNAALMFRVARPVPRWLACLLVGSAVVSAATALLFWRLPAAVAAANATVTATLSAATSVSPTTGGADKLPTLAGYVLVWSDEFNGADGTVPDPAKWAYDIGGNGWGNHELEYYTNHAQNAHLASGKLVITALQETTTTEKGETRSYTSARLKTQGIFAQAYGRFEARIKIPHGEGMWPAFWLLGEDISTVHWPRCGEIDIMENIGKEPGTVHGSLHGAGVTTKTADRTSTFLLPGKPNLSDDFHVYAVEWEPDVIRFYLDEHNYATFQRKDWPDGAQWPFDHKFFVIVNLAVGGDWPGPPDSSTIFPKQMLVDYVRVYARAPDAH
jgi:beta-glucanase (GH16 family)